MCMGTTFGEEDSGRTFRNEKCTDAQTHQTPLQGETCLWGRLALCISQTQAAAWLSVELSPWTPQK